VFDVDKGTTDESDDANSHDLASIDEGLKDERLLRFLLLRTRDR
jgi:hypothetical protein